MACPSSAVNAPEPRSSGLAVDRKHFRGAGRRRGVSQARLPREPGRTGTACSPSDSAQGNPYVQSHQNTSSAGGTTGPCGPYINLVVADGRSYSANEGPRTLNEAVLTYTSRFQRPFPLRFTCTMVRITARLGGQQRAVLEPTANHRPRPLCPRHHRRQRGPNCESDQHDDLPPAPDAGRHRTPGDAINSVAAVTGPRRPQESLIAMAGILVTEQSLEKTLRQILELACAALPGGDEGGITLLEAEGPGTAIATSDVARRIDRSQYDAINRASDRHPHRPARLLGRARLSPAGHGGPAKPAPPHRRSRRPHPADQQPGTITVNRCRQTGRDSAPGPTRTLRPRVPG